MSRNDSELDQKHIDAMVNSAKNERSRAMSGFFRSMWGQQTHNKSK